MRGLFLALAVAALTLSGCVMQEQWNAGGGLDTYVANIKSVNGEQRFNLCRPKVGMSTDGLVAMCGEPDHKVKGVAYDGNMRKDECWVYRTWASNGGNASHVAACFANRVVEGMTREDPGGVKFEVTRVTGLTGLPEMKAPEATPAAAPAAPAPVTEEPAATPTP